MPPESDKTTLGKLSPDRTSGLSGPGVPHPAVTVRARGRGRGGGGWKGREGGCRPSRGPGIPPAPPPAQARWEPGLRAPRAQAAQTAEGGGGGQAESRSLPGPAADALLRETPSPPRPGRARLPPSSPVLQIHLQDLPVALKEALHIALAGLVAQAADVHARHPGNGGGGGGSARPQPPGRGGGGGDTGRTAGRPRRGGIPDTRARTHVARGRAPRSGRRGRTGGSGLAEFPPSLPGAVTWSGGGFRSRARAKSSRDRGA